MGIELRELKPLIRSSIINAWQDALVSRIDRSGQVRRSLSQVAGVQKAEEAVSPAGTVFQNNPRSSPSRKRVPIVLGSLSLLERSALNPSLGVKPYIFLSVDEVSYGVSITSFPLALILRSHRT